LCILLIQTYSIEDCNYYNSGDITSVTELTVPSLPVNFKASWKLQRVGSGASTSWLEVGTDSNNCILGGQTGSNQQIGIFCKVGGTYVASQSENGVFPQGVDSLTELAYNDGTITISYGNTTKTITSTQITSRTFVRANIVSNHMKELKIKPL